MLIPVLALQPLIENVVKHNVITSDEPLTITITGNASGITVLNPLKPRKDKIEQGGMGLKNLKNRYKLLTGMDIIIENDGVIFSVTLPLVNPEMR
jgi:LytS/YehU family sensor histidine kinase